MEPLKGFFRWSVFIGSPVFLLVESIRLNEKMLTLNDSRKTLMMLGITVASHFICNSLAKSQAVATVATFSLLGVTLYEAPKLFTSVMDRQDFYVLGPAIILVSLISNYNSRGGVTVSQTFGGH